MPQFGTEVAIWSARQPLADQRALDAIESLCVARRQNSRSVQARCSFQAGISTADNVNQHSYVTNVVW
jgi:hypothetical protein